MLSLSGKISKDVMEAVKKDPERMSEAVRSFGSMGDWLGIELAVAYVFVLSLTDSPEKDTKKEWMNLMRELRKGTEKQLEVINNIRILMDSWENDING